MTSIFGIPLRVPSLSLQPLSLFIPSLMSAADIHDNSRKIAHSKALAAAENAATHSDSIKGLNRIKTQISAGMSNQGLLLSLKEIVKAPHWQKLCIAVAVAVYGDPNASRGEQLLTADPHLPFTIKCAGDSLNLIDRMLTLQQEQHEQQLAIAHLQELSMHLFNVQRFRELASSADKSTQAGQAKFLQHTVDAQMALTSASNLFDRLPSAIRGALCFAVYELDNRPGLDNYGLNKIKSDPLILLHYKGKSIIDTQCTIHSSSRVLTFERPALPAEKYKATDSPLIAHDQATLQTLEEFLQHLNTPAKDNDFLKGQFFALPTNVRNYLGYMLWIVYNKPDILNFGDTEILRDVRALLNVQNPDKVNIISQLIQHYKARVDIGRQEKALRDFKIIISTQSIGNQVAWFNAIDPALQTTLARHVWLNDGGRNNPSFTSNLNYGQDHIRANPKGKLLSGNPSIIDSLLPGMQAKLSLTLHEAADEFSRTLTSPSQPADASFRRLAAQLGLIDELPEDLRVAVVTAELTDVINQGGLASAVDGMARGMDPAHVRIIMPKYDVLPDTIKLTLKPDYELEHAGQVTRVFKAKINGLRCYFIENNHLFSVGKRHNGSPNSVYAATNEWTEKARWAFFSSAAAELTYKLGKKKKPVQIVHSYDAQTALVPGIIKTRHPEEWRRGETAASVLTFHNHLVPLWFNDGTGREVLAKHHLPPKHTALTDGFENAEMCTTVSETFAEEAQSVKLGFGLQDRVRRLAAQEKLVGIVNGPSNGWDPRTTGALKNWDSYLEKGKKVDLTFGPDDSNDKLLATKTRCRAELCAALKENFPETDFDPKQPIALFTARFDSSQKGLDKLPLIMEEIVKRGGQFIIAGIDPTDDAATRLLASIKQTIKDRNLKGCFLLIDERDPKTKKLRWQFGEKNLAAIMRAGASFVVAPSRYEPCGLIHLELRRFGVPALASDTGGHHDTIITSGPHKNGYLFKSENNWWSKEQDAAVVSSIDLAMKDAHTSLAGIYGSNEEALKAYLDATRTMIRDGLASSWEHSPDDSPSPIQRLEYVYAQAIRNRREKRGKVQINARLLS